MRSVRCVDAATGARERAHGQAHRGIDRVHRHEDRLDAQRARRRGARGAAVAFGEPRVEAVAQVHLQFAAGLLAPRGRGQAGVALDVGELEAVVVGEGGRRAFRSTGRGDRRQHQQEEGRPGKAA